MWWCWEGVLYPKGPKMGMLVREMPQETPPPREGMLGVLCPVGPPCRVGMSRGTPCGDAGGICALQHPNVGMVVSVPQRTPVQGCWGLCPPPRTAHLQPSTPAHWDFPGRCQGVLVAPGGHPPVGPMPHTPEWWGPVLERGLLGMLEPPPASNPIDFQ